MQFMVVEHIRPGGLEAVYERYRGRGRMLPDGLVFVDSWLVADGRRCFQLMRTDDYRLFAAWTARCSDLIDFEIVPLGDKPAPQRYGPIGFRTGVLRPTRSAPVQSGTFTGRSAGTNLRWPDGRRHSSDGCRCPRRSCP